MSHQPINYLRLYRKRSPITQADIAYLLNMPDYSGISRYEKGQRSPSVELLLVYHHLFNTSIESFFEPHSQIVRSNLGERMRHLVGTIHKEEMDPKSLSRIRFLEEAITRLTT